MRFFKDMGGNKEPMKEKDWTNLDDPGLSAYSKSKHLAEKAAWDFVTELPGWLSNCLLYPILASERLYGKIVAEW